MVGINVWQDINSNIHYKLYRVIYYLGNFLLLDTTRVPELEKSPRMSMHILFN